MTDWTAPGTFSVGEQPTASKMNDLITALTELQTALTPTVEVFQPRAGWTVKAYAAIYPDFVLLGGYVKKDSGTIGTEGGPKLPADVGLTAYSGLMTASCAQRSGGPSSSTIVAPAGVSFNGADQSVTFVGGSVGDTVFFDGVVLSRVSP